MSDEPQGIDPDAMRGLVKDLLNQVPHALQGYHFMVEDAYLAAKVSVIIEDQSLSTVTVIHTLERNPWQLIGILVAELGREMGLLREDWKIE